MSDIRIDPNAPSLGLKVEAAAPSVERPEQMFSPQQIREVANGCESDANYILRKGSSVGTSGDVEHNQRIAAMLRFAADRLSATPDPASASCPNVVFHRNRDEGIEARDARCAHCEAITRYEVDSFDTETRLVHMRPSPDGEWVRYADLKPSPLSREDHAAVTEKLEMLAAHFEKRGRNSTIPSSSDCWNTAASDTRAVLAALRGAR